MCVCARARVCVFVHVFVATLPNLIRKFFSSTAKILYSIFLSLFLSNAFESNKEYRYRSRLYRFRIYICIYIYV